MKKNNKNIGCELCEKTLRLEEKTQRSEHNKFVMDAKKNSL